MFIQKHLFITDILAKIDCLAWSKILCLIIGSKLEKVKWIFHKSLPWGGGGGEVGALRREKTAI